MTPSDGSGLPPSFTPGSGSSDDDRPRVRRRSVSAGHEAARRLRAARSRSDGAAPVPPGRAGGAERGAPAQAGSAVGRGDAGPARSRARAGSSAVPVGEGATPDRTRVMRARPASAAPAGAAAAGAPQSRAAARGSFPVSGRASARPGTGTPVGGTPRPGSFAPVGAAPSDPTPPAAPRRRRRRHPVLKGVALVLVVLLALIGARAAWLWHDVDSKLHRVDALSGAADTSGETWLIVGSDSRADGAVSDGTEGARSDSIMVLHKAANGQTALVSLPRDTFVQIPGYGGNKINAAYSYGGAPLLVRTVEQLTGLTIDHYAEVGMGGVEQLVNAVGGITVCLDYNVNDADSGLVWDTSKGTCQQVDGTKALAYSRMRESDPTGDIGRGLRQRAVIAAVVAKAASPSTLLSMSRQDAIVDAGTSVLTVGQSDGTLDLAKMVLAFRSASGSGLTGAPPIASLDYEPGGIGSAVLLKDTTAPTFFQALRDGTLTSQDFNKS